MNDLFRMYLHYCEDVGGGAGAVVGCGAHECSVSIRGRCISKSGPILPNQETSSFDACRIMVRARAT